MPSLCSYVCLRSFVSDWIFDTFTVDCSDTRWLSGAGGDPPAFLGHWGGGRWQRHSLQELGVATSHVSLCPQSTPDFVPIHLSSNSLTLKILPYKTISLTLKILPYKTISLTLKILSYETVTCWMVCGPSPSLYLAPLTSAKTFSV